MNDCGALQFSLVRCGVVVAWLFVGLYGSRWDDWQLLFLFCGLHFTNCSWSTTSNGKTLVGVPFQTE